MRDWEGNLGSIHTGIVARKPLPLTMEVEHACICLWLSEGQKSPCGTGRGEDGEKKNRKKKTPTAQKTPENYFTFLVRAKWCSGLQMPALLVLWGHRWGTARPCHASCAGKSGWILGVPSATWAGWGCCAIWEREPAPVSMGSTQSFPESCLIYRVLSAGKGRLRHSLPLFSPLDFKIFVWKRS